MKLIIVARNLSNEDELSTLLLNEVGEFNYIFIRPQDNSYKVEEIRNFIDQLNRKQNDFTRKNFYIFLNGDKLSPVCQNALLKTLEESNYSIGIIVNNESSLLPTIQSRCQKVYLKNPSEIKEQNEITFDDISSISKLERQEVIKKLEQFMYSISPSQSLVFQDAINKLHANCKVEAVLYELVNNLKALA